MRTAFSEVGCFLSKKGFFYCCFKSQHAEDEERGACAERAAALGLQGASSLRPPCRVPVRPGCSRSDKGDRRPAIYLLLPAGGRRLDPTATLKD